MNSTRTCVTPPREPKFVSDITFYPNPVMYTCSAEDAGNLDKLDGNLGGIHCIVES